MGRLTGAPMIVASVQAGPPVLPISTPGVPYAVGRTDENLIADCAEALAEVDAELRAAGTPVECCKLEGTSAASALHEVVEAEDALLLVVGSDRPRGVERLVLGSTAQRLLHGAPCRVAVVPLDRDRHGLETIGVVLGSSGSGRQRRAHGHPGRWARVDGGPARRPQRPATGAADRVRHARFDRPARSGAGSAEALRARRLARLRARTHRGPG
jgi:nucleotide-binding universal stress UspA family protein